MASTMRSSPMGPSLERDVLNNPKIMAEVAAYQADPVDVIEE